MTLELISGYELERGFVRLSRLACRMFGVEIATPCFLDRELKWSNSPEIFHPNRIVQDSPMVHHVHGTQEALVIPDTAKDWRFWNEDQKIRFYAGVPLFLKEHCIGVFCLSDPTVIDFSPEDLFALKDFAAMIEEEITSIQKNTQDELTKILNYRGLLQFGEQACRLSRREFTSLCCLFFDLNEFKKINDTYGHKAGDEALIKFAEVLHTTCRLSDVVARKSGDEFVVLLNKATPLSVKALLNRLDKLLVQENQKTPYKLSYSIGAATLKPNQTLEDLIIAADSEMYLHKKGIKPSLSLWG